MLRVSEWGPENDTTLELECSVRVLQMENNGKGVISSFLIRIDCLIWTWVELCSWIYGRMGSSISWLICAFFFMFYGCIIRTLERRLKPIVKPQIQEEQCGYCSGRGTGDQLFTLAELLEGSCEFSPFYMCPVVLEKVCLMGILLENRVLRLLLQAIQSLYNQSESSVPIFGRKSNTSSYFIIDSLWDF